MNAARAFLEELGLGELVTRERATKVELRCPAEEHADRTASACTFSETLVTVCGGCAKAWSPYALALERGLSPREATELLIRFGVREERRPDARATPRAARTPPAPPRRQTSPVAARSLAPAAAEALELELSACIGARREVDWLLEAFRGFDARVLDRLGCGFGRADRLAGFSSYAAGSAPRLLVPVRDLGGQLVSVAALDPRPADERPPDVRKVAVPANVDRHPLLVQPVVPTINGLVLVVEGEADALAAGSVALAAVGVPGHAGAVRHAETIAAFARALDASRVVVVPDGDARSAASFAELTDAIAAAGVSAVFRPVMEEGRDLGDVVCAELAPVFPASLVDRLEAGRRISAVLDVGGLE